MFEKALLPLSQKIIALTCVAGLTLAQLPAFAVEHAAEVQMDSDQKILHLLNRLTYGPRPGDVDDVKKMGVEQFIQQQLHPETIQMPEALNSYVDGVESINSTPSDLFRQYSIVALRANKNVGGRKLSDDERKDLQKEQGDNYRKLYNESASARLRRAVESPRQLQELMVDFWFNHFNVSNDKGLVHLWTGAYEQQAIRPYVFGHFRDLVEATAHHPAMLFYLDNWQNTKPGGIQFAGRGKGSKNNFEGLNENYARELMELHTLGVDGGYTQADVIALAKVLTGLGLPPQNPALLRIGQVEIGRFGSAFAPQRHDFGDKVLLGTTIRGTGEPEIEQAIDILCKAPATAHHISYQMAQYFVCDEPPKALVDHLSETYLRTDGDIRAMLNDLFHSHEFWNPKFANSKFKSPYRFVISSLRASNVALADYKPVLGFLRQLGMPLYGCLTPDGYKNTQTAWLSPDALLRRIQFATGLGTGKLPNNPLDPLDYKDVSTSMNGLFSNNTLTVVASAPAGLKSSVLLGSPEFMNY